ncbi:MAG: sprT domain-containing protein [Pedobacter sp.]|nr:MAG: sprT domain-containing protein [Pedobacter sp.]
MDKTHILAQYMPEKAAPHIAKWIDFFQCEFKISKKRQTKLGDYRHPFKGKGHKISVNGDLNPYAFLVTTVHEFAHLLTYNEHKNKVKPHGQEWKQNFHRMMQPFFKEEVFPPTIQTVIAQYLHNPAASSCSDLSLARALKQYDLQVSSSVSSHSPIHGLAEHTIENIPLGTPFFYKDGRQFIRGEKLRKRYRCTCVKTGRVYLFYPLAVVGVNN